MKKLILFSNLIYLLGTAFGQNQVPTYDSTFKALYKAVALHPGYVDREGRMNDSVIRRWDRDIKICIDGGSGKSRREILRKLKATIALVTPSLGNKIKIVFVDDRQYANYLINLDFLGRSGWHLKWDGLNNIYNCLVFVNTRAIFNLDEQAGLVSHYFLQSLGDFVFNKKDRSDLIKSDPAEVSNVSIWRQDINNIDLQIIKMHYADDVKPGMAEKDIDLVFEKHGI